jgi:hypothetical protein
LPDGSGKKRKRVCAEAWRFAYGISEQTYIRQIKEIRNPEKKLRKMQEFISSYTPSEANFLAWLQLQVEQVGDKLPFGDCGGFQIRLPYPTKKLSMNCLHHFVKRALHTIGLLFSVTIKLARCGNIAKN